MEEEREQREEDEQMVEVNGARTPSPSQNGCLVEERILALVKNDVADFGAWTSIISEIENISPSDIESICKVYDAFLSKFPLCYGYWKKYVSHMAYHCNLNEVQKVYEKAVEAISYSVDLWVSYCDFGVLAYEDPDDVRRLFERGLSFVGKDYLSHLLWDKYIEFEYSQKQWSHLAYIYISNLRFPTKKLNDYYMRFKKLVGIWEEEMGCERNTTMDNGSCENTYEKACKPAEFMSLIRNPLSLQDGLPKPSTVKKYFSTGELLYHRSSQLDEKIDSYETRIMRPYFDVKPLDDFQLENWHQYLDFVEMQGDFDWTVKLYERCLIPCANYPEFWIRYIEFVEAKGGREIANHALGRALNFFSKRVPAFHLYCSMFKEKTGDVNGAHDLFLQPEIELDPEFIENVIRKANMEKRMGDTDSAYMVYEKAIEMAKAKENLQILSILYVKFARFTFVVSNDINAAIDVFLRGIREVPCKSTIQEMMNFLTLCGGPGQIPKLDLNVANMIAPESVISQSLNSRDCQEIASLFLEFVDLHGTIHDVRKAWDRYRKLFPHIMKPIAKSHCTPIGDDPLVKEVVGRTQMFVPGSSQARGNDGHDVSRIHLLDCQPPEDNGIPSDGMVTGNSQDDINDNKGNGKMIEVAEEVEKHVNDDKGREALVEVAEDVDKQSLNDAKGKEEPLEVAEDVEMQSIPEGLELHEEARLATPECQDAVQVPKATPVYPKVETLVQSHPEQGPGDNLRPPSLENPLHSPDNETQQSKPSASRDHNIPQEVTSGAGENVLLDEGNSDEVSTIRISEPIDTKPSTPSQVQGNSSSLHSVCDSTPPESQSNSQSKKQSHAQISPQLALPVDVAYAQTASSTGNLPQMYYAQSSQSQQWQVHPQLTDAGTTNTQMVVAQGYPYQSQAWTGTVDQQANQTFGQYPVATAQMYPIGNLAWPGQSAQQQAYAYIQPQSGTQPQLQSHVSQQSVQSNELQHGYIQNSQGIPPHILQYYQQQYYYRQQQQQQTSQLQSNSQPDQKNSQPDQKTDQLQQMNPSQQQQQLNQQILSQQQQQLPNQQRSNQQQTQQNQQSSQQLQQHQLAQYQQQNQQVLNTQQYQQLVYMQQQQQQQLYLQQQQQYYLHQQQLLQQQQFQQLSQQEQQALLQQQQQLLHQQQHQQVFHLQQQHQQQLQQLQQQSVQHQLQQQPVQQEQLSASDQNVLSSNYIQQVQQRSGNHDGPGCSEQSIKSQGEGDKLQNSEQSGPFISPHSQSPQNQ